MGLLTVFGWNLRFGQPVQLHFDCQMRPRLCGPSGWSLVTCALTEFIRDHSSEREDRIFTVFKPRF